MPDTKSNDKLPGDSEFLRRVFVYLERCIAP